jgi:hypothetical protein
VDAGRPRPRPWGRGRRGRRRRPRGPAGQLADLFGGEATAGSMVPRWDLDRQVEASHGPEGPSGGAAQHLLAPLMPIELGRYPHPSSNRRTACTESVVLPRARPPRGRPRPRPGRDGRTARTRDHVDALGLSDPLLGPAAQRRPRLRDGRGILSWSLCGLVIGLIAP